MRHLSLYRAVVCGVCHVISRGCRWRGRCLRRREHGWLFVYEFSKFGPEMVHWDLGRQCKEAQKEEQQNVMINLGVFPAFTSMQFVVVEALFEIPCLRKMDRDG
jgi:hypothetical protein